MKRGFLNTPQYKQAVERTSQTCHGDAPARRDVEHGGEDQDVMDVDISTGGATAQTRDPNDGHSDKGETKDEVMGDKAKTAVVDSTDVDDAVDSTVDAEVRQGDADHKAKGKAKAVDADPDEPVNMLPDWRSDVSADSFIIKFPLDPAVVRPRPRRPGLGRPMSEDILHTVPKSCGSDRKRAIFRLWPRPPDGKPMLPREGRKYKVSPDGFPWGATLYDFYAVHRLPACVRALSYTNGSMLMEEMKELEEFGVAEEEMNWAMSEGEPTDEGVANTEVLINCADLRIRIFCGDNDSGSRRGVVEKGKGGEKGEKEEGVEYIVHHPFLPPPLEIPVTSPFHSSHYPKPWPIAPFQEPQWPILLQESIPAYLLPQTLHVHDPFNLLSARKRASCNTPWDASPDVVREYKLQHDKSVREGLDAAKRKAIKLEEFKARTLIVFRYMRTMEQIQNCEPVIEVPLPPYVRRPTETKEAHLYLSPAAIVGEGNHSIVYKAEWELPRDLFVKPALCAKCFKESADKEIQRLKDTGRWGKLLKAAGWGPKGFTGREPTRAELEAANDPVDLGMDGEIIEREVICIVASNITPARVLEAISNAGIWDKFMEQRDVNKMVLNLVGPQYEDSPPDSNVAGIRINPPFSSEGRKSCKHNNTHPTPLTAMFTIIAKLSLEHDQHLVREAGNYQQFPKHFFHHYDGYIIISQLRALVPVHAIVPQFYGYYVPQKDSNDKKQRESYLSPILLLEHCGKPVDPHALSTEDQEECASMLLRFQQAGWIHESVAPRNFLVQKGKPTEFPLQREARPELSFRLIDFGRSRKYTRVVEKQREEFEALEMFAKLLGQMAVSLP